MKDPWEEQERHEMQAEWEDAIMAENAKLRKLAGGMYGILATFDAILGNHDACETPRPLIFGESKSFKDVMRELGIKVGG